MYMCTVADCTMNSVDIEERSFAGSPAQIHLLNAMLNVRLWRTARKSCFWIRSIRSMEVNREGLHRLGIRRPTRKFLPSAPPADARRASPHARGPCTPRCPASTRPDRPCGCSRGASRVGPASRRARGRLAARAGPMHRGSSARTARPAGAGAGRRAKAHPDAQHIAQTTSSTSTKPLLSSLLRIARKIAGL